MATIGYMYTRVQDMMYSTVHKSSIIMATVG